MTSLFKSPWAREPTKHKNKHVIVTLANPKPLYKTDPRYLSFSIDISVLAGGFWWEGSSQSHKGLGTQRIPPFNLQQKKMEQLVRALGPAYLRVGGSEADKIHYFRPPKNLPYALTLTHFIWDNLQDFCQRNDLLLMFTMKYGLFNRKYHGDWKSHEIENLLHYNQEQGHRIAVYELGNELNAYWAFHGISSQPTSKRLAKDYDAFIRVIRKYDSKAQIAGPGSAFWPRIGEAIKPLSNITPGFLRNMEEKLDIIDWHYYPFQSSRSPVRTRAANLKNTLSPEALRDYEKYLKQLIKWRDMHQPHALIWTGETGSAQCGGEAKLSDRFASSFWWADQLGRGARLGQKVMVRQSLVGGDYGLIQRQTLRPNPDYWVCWLWGKLMGTDVYEVQSNDPYVQTYCHSAKKEGKCTLLMINMSSSPKVVHCHGFGLKKKRFELTADSLTSRKIRINGVRPKFNNGNIKLRDFPKLSKLNLLSPYSINFWCFSI